MINILILILALILLAALLVSSRKSWGRAEIISKTLLSCLFIVTALIMPHNAISYYYPLLIGLIFCLLGDISLAMPDGKWFTVGLVAFLLGHLFYIPAFMALVPLSKWITVGAVGFILLSVGVFMFLLPHLGSMRWPVAAYVIVITVMVCGGWAVLTKSDLKGAGPIMIFAGAALFYLSDLFVARNRFVKKEFINRLIGLPLYYAGQFLLVFSLSFVTLP